MKYSCKEIEKKTRTSLRTVQRWAALNGVPYVGEGRRKIFIWDDEDIVRFLHRPGAGRPTEKH